MKRISKTICLLCFLAFTNALQAQIPTQAEDISPLLIGETIPNASLIDAEGTQYQLFDMIDEKPTVLIFYRGGWCPYCNMQLAGLVEIEKYILDLGYQIIAISPDHYQNLKTTQEKERINYSLFSDPNGTMIQDIGIAFQTPTRLKDYISSQIQNGKPSDIMPVPTVMVIDKNGNILFEYINPNYKERISGKMLLAVLQTFK